MKGLDIALHQKRIQEKTWKQPFQRNCPRYISVMAENAIWILSEKTDLYYAGRNSTAERDSIFDGYTDLLFF